MKKKENPVVEAEAFCFLYGLCGCLWKAFSDSMEEPVSKADLRQ